jgi:hypothetical protein
MGTYDHGGKKVMASGRAQLFQPRRRQAWK